MHELGPVHSPNSHLPSAEIIQTSVMKLARTLMVVYRAQWRVFTLGTTLSLTMQPYLRCVGDPTDTGRCQPSHSWSGMAEDIGWKFVYIMTIMQVLENLTRLYLHSLICCDIDSDFARRHTSQCGLNCTSPAYFDGVQFVKLVRINDSILSGITSMVETTSRKFRKPELFATLASESTSLRTIPTACFLRKEFLATEFSVLQKCVGTLYSYYITIESYGDNVKRRRKK